MFQTILPPWLIQRATIPSPLADSDATLTQSLQLDYMGSAEFEFGSLPKSLKVLRSAHGQGNMVIRLAPDLRQGDSPLRVLSTFDADTFDQYSKELHKLRYLNPHTKEKTYFQFDIQKRYPGFKGCDFWWDLNNHTMWSFDERYMDRLVQYLENSFNILPKVCK